MQSIRQYRWLQKEVVVPPSENTETLQKKRTPESPASGSSETSNGFQDPYILVDLEGPLDPAHPRNWLLLPKINVSTIIFINVFVLDRCSGVDSQTGVKIAADFHVGRMSESLSSACYVFDIAIGALFAGPIF